MKLTRLTFVVLIYAIFFPLNNMGWCSPESSWFSNTHSEKLPSGVDGTDLLQIWGTSDNDLYAIGQGGLIVHYNGKAWKRMNSGTSAILNDICGLDSSHIYVVGSDISKNGEGLILGYDGREWNPMNIKTKSALFGIWASSPNRIFAVGSHGTILYYDGKKWDYMKAGFTEGLLSVWGINEESVFAVGNNGAILRYNGKSWKKMNSPVNVDLSGISGTSNSSVYAIGKSATVLEFDGQNWNVIMSKDTKSRWNGIHAFPNGEVRVVGWDSRTAGIEMYYYEKEWGDTRTTSSKGKWSEINSVWGFSLTNYFTVGLDGIEHRYD